MKAVVLLSGGLDSTVTAAKALTECDEVVALSFRYGQRHTRELDSAADVCGHYGMRHVIVDIDLGMFRSSLIRSDMGIPKDRDIAGMAEEIPDTYVPARNIIMLSVAAGLCESVGGEAIYIGANSIDYSGYPDCRPEFFEQFRRTIAVGTKAGTEGRPIDIRTPILDLGKADIVRLGTELGAPLEMTWSCYDGGEAACGRCDSCRLRLKGFKEAGIEDPVRYAE